MVKHPALRRSKGASLTDLLVVVALIPVCGALFIGCYEHRHDGSNRVKCAANLKAIGNALLMYSNDNKGAYPRTRYLSGPTVIPTFGTGAATTQPFAENGPQPNDVTAAIYLLLTHRTSPATASSARAASRRNGISAAVLTAPGTGPTGTVPAMFENISATATKIPTVTMRR